MNNLREVTDGDRSRLITSKASGLPSGTGASHGELHKGAAADEGLVKA